MDEEDTTDKEHDATQAKLDAARAKGQVVKSTELATAAGYGGFLIAAVGTGAAALEKFGAGSANVIDRSDSLPSLFLSGGSVTALVVVGSILATLLPFFLIPVVTVFGVILGQRALVFAPEKLLPKLSRIDPLNNAVQKFGADGIFEFGKSTIKLALVSLVLGFFLWSRLPRIMFAQALAPNLIVVELFQMIMEFLMFVLVVVTAIGAVDYLWQHYAHLRRNRMSRQELVDEMKQSEGDPHLRNQRRQRAQAIALNQMLSDVRKADVIIVNPTHYAVALRWNRSSRRAPICVAKGVDETAARIREVAATAGVPIHSDPSTARALFATVKIGEEVMPTHYAPVAAAIRFAEKMRKRAGGHRQ